MRTNLKVPFAEKDEAKKLGARWDAARKIWYVENAPDLAPFARWSPTAQLGSGETAPATKAVSTRNQQATGKSIVGSDYKVQPRVCECLPWEVCAKCEAVAIKH